MGLLVDHQIEKHLRDGNIVIDPFDPRQSGNTSYDVRLGPWVVRQNRNPSPENTFIDPWCKADAMKMWGKPEYAPEAVKALPEHEAQKTRSFGLHDLIIVVRPLETILAHTIEFIGGRYCVTTGMSARSSAGRMCVEVCKDAGWGDVGYINRWTMEVTNNSDSYCLILPVGRRIAQIDFSEVEPPNKRDYSAVGKYQHGSNIAEIKKNWKPEDMLAQLWLDWDLKESQSLFAF